MNNKKIKDLREKILKGIELAYLKMIITKSKNNEELVYSKNGNIIFVKASELIK